MYPYFSFFLFFFFILNKTTSCKNKISFPSESDMMSKELQNSDSIYVNLMTDVFKIIAKYLWKIIAKYHHLSPCGNQALVIVSKFCFYYVIDLGWARFCSPWNQLRVIRLLLLLGGNGVFSWFTRIHQMLL